MHSWDAAVTTRCLTDHLLYSRRSKQPDRLERLAWVVPAASARSIGVDTKPSHFTSTDPIQTMLLDRNDTMADRIDHLFTSGTCTAAVMLTGMTHLGVVPHPSGDLAGLVGATGLPVTTLVVDDDSNERTTHVRVRTWTDDPDPHRRSVCVDRHLRWFEPRARPDATDHCGPSRLPQWWWTLHQTGPAVGPATLGP